MQLATGSVPGALELIERDELDDEIPEFSRIPLPASMRAFEDPLDVEASTGRWRALLQRLRGYRKAEVLLDREPVWVPLVDLQVPPGGASTFVYTRTLSATDNLDVKILGVGFGSAASVTFVDSLTLPAAGTGKVLRVRMLMTATRYESQGGDSLVRVDIDPADVVEHEVADLEATPPAELADTLAWRVLRRERLSAAGGSGRVSWAYSAGRDARWNANIGVTLPQVGTSIALGVEAAGAEETTVTFELPYGKDYVFYVPVGQTPLAPRVALLV
jgi:hypothetical protein